MNPRPKGPVGAVPGRCRSRVVEFSPLRGGKMGVCRKGAWGIGRSVVLAALLAGCGHGTPQAGHKPPSTTAPAARTSPASHGSTTTSTSTTTTHGGDRQSMKRSSLPVVSCPTKFALATPPPIVPTPRIGDSQRTHCAGREAGRLHRYQRHHEAARADGWSCSASFGADGSGIVTIVPKGESLPASGLTSDSSDQAITAYETGGSSVQAAAAACSVFPAAAAATESDLGKGCSPRPPSEIVDPLSTSVVDFEDPAGVKGYRRPFGRAGSGQRDHDVLPDDGGARLLPRDVHSRGE